MKNVYKIMALILLMFLGYEGDTIAYDYTIFNKTGRDIKVQLKTKLGIVLNKDFVSIKSGKSHEFPFGGVKISLCVGKIMVKVKEEGKWKNEREAKIKLTRCEKIFSLCTRRTFDLHFVRGSKLEARDRLISCKGFTLDMR